MDMPERDSMPDLRPSGRPVVLGGVDRARRGAGALAASGLRSVAGVSCRGPSPAGARSTKSIPYAGGARAMPLGPAEATARVSCSWRLGDFAAVDLVGMFLVL